MTHFVHRAFTSAVAAFCIVAVLGPATAQEQPGAQRNDGLFGGLFNRGRGQEQQAAPGMSQASEADMTVRLDRLENALRQVTGMVEQLQYRNQQLEQLVRKMQEDAEFRGAGAGAGAPPSRPTAPQPRVSTGFPPPQATPAAPPQPPPPPAAPGRRSDAFDPSQNPTAPGAPRALGSPNVGAIMSDEPPVVGAPGGRTPGTPLDLSTMAGNAAHDTALPTPGGLPQQGNVGALPPPPPRNPNATGGQLAAVLPPSQTPKDEYDLGYGYMLRKDYALAEETFRSFLRKYPSDRMTADAQFWLGESLFQRQRYRDSAESFLNVTTKFETAQKAPDALLRLGQSLAALGEREAACAALGEIGRKYPRASLNVKQGVQQAQKRATC